MHCTSEGVPEMFLCPIGMEVMMDPVVTGEIDLPQHLAFLHLVQMNAPLASSHCVCHTVFADDGHTYERSQIEAWLRDNDRSPLTNLRLPSKRLTPNHVLRSAIATWFASHGDSAAGRPASGSGQEDPEPSAPLLEMAPLFIDLNHARALYANKNWDALRRVCQGGWYDIDALEELGDRAFQAYDAKESLGDLGEGLGKAVPLHMEAAQGRTMLVATLVEVAAQEPDMRTTVGRVTPLMLAAAAGRLETVRWLVVNGNADVNVTAADGSTAAHRAAEAGHVAVLQALVELGRADMETPRSDGKTHLLMACSKGDLETSRWLIEHGASLAAVDAGGDGVAHHAVRSGNKDLVLYLGQDGLANFELRNKKGATPLALAATQGDGAMCDVLIWSCRASPHSVLQGDPSRFPDKDLMLRIHPGNVICEAFSKAAWGVVRAAAQGSDYAVDSFIEVAQGGVLERRPRWAVTQGPCAGSEIRMAGATHYAAAIGDLRLLVPLVEVAGLSPVTLDAHGRTALHWAAAGGDSRCIGWLLGVMTAEQCKIPDSKGQTYEDLKARGIVPAKVEFKSPVKAYKERLAKEEEEVRKARAKEEEERKKKEEERREKRKQYEEEERKKKAEQNAKERERCASDDNPCRHGLTSPQPFIHGHSLAATVFHVEAM